MRALAFLSSKCIVTDVRVALMRALATHDHSSRECLGLHLGAPQTANLGDGNGSLNQTIEFREDFGNDFLGTCLESLLGGNHFR